MGTSKRLPIRRSAGFTLIELMIVVAILGILAVVAIPAFVRYMRVAKTAEAHRMVDKLIRGARAYFVSPKYDSNGNRLGCYFPEVGPSRFFSHPDRNFCCRDGEADGKCEPNETIWDKETWKALLFKLSDKHYYVYMYAAQMTPSRENHVMAGGDLDCDGTYSTFYMAQYGLTGTDGITNCRVRKHANLAIANETE